MTSFQNTCNAGLKRINKITFSEEETLSIGHLVAKDLKLGAILAFFGDLGTGKTTFIKALAQELIDTHPNEVNSPTFTYLNIYEGKFPVYHFDLYRLKNTQDFLERGFDEYFDADGICCIEWAERIKPILPKNALHIHIKHLGENKRELTIT